MSAEMYEILSLFARYFFAALMAVIVFRAWRITIKDNRRARMLRAWSPETGCVGQFVVNPGAKDAALAPIPREGVLGSSRNADICIRLPGVRAEHAHLEARSGGILIRPLGRAQIAPEGGEPGKKAIFAKDGDTLTVGSASLVLVLFDPSTMPLEEPLPVASPKSRPKSPTVRPSRRTKKEEK